MEHTRDIMMDIIQQFTTNIVVEQEKACMKLPSLNLGELMNDRPHVATQNIEYLLLNLLKTMHSNVNPMELYKGAATTELEGSSLTPLTLPSPTDTAMWALIRFLAWNGKTVDHNQHIEHLPFWRESELQAANSNGRKMELDRSAYAINRQVKGLRAFHTSYLSAVEGKLMRQCKAPPPLTAGKDDDDAKLILHLEGQLAGAMTEAHNFTEQLPSNLLTMKKGAVRPWLALEGSDQEKNLYLQQLMKDVHYPVQDVLQWGQDNGLYKA